MRGNVPRVAEVDGATVAIYFQDHQPPHFHARFAEHHVVIAIADLSILKGELPRPQMRAVVLWAAANSALLNKWWDQAQLGEAFP